MYLAASSSHAIIITQSTSVLSSNSTLNPKKPQ